MRTITDFVRIWILIAGSMRVWTFAFGLDFDDFVIFAGLLHDPAFIVVLKMDQSLKLLKLVLLIMGYYCVLWRLEVSQNNFF